MASKPVDFSELKETSYAFLERLRFIRRSIKPGPFRVMDVGCGTAMLLSGPMAQEFPEASFTLVEPDQRSRDLAKENTISLPNCRVLPTMPKEQKFDLVIASEVLEHVSDPVSFLREIRGRIVENGRLVITVPNGFGPSEFLASLEFLLKIAKRSLFRQEAQSPTGGTDTLADSPHIQFYSKRTLSLALRAAGFRIVKIEGRMFVCGFPVSLLIDRIPTLQKLNIRLAKILPLALVSDWMIECVATTADNSLAFPAPGLFVRAKRALTTHPLVSSSRSLGGNAVDFFSATSAAFRNSYNLDPDFKVRLQTWNYLIDKNLGDRSRALDLGCGPGLMTKLLLEKGLSVTAADAAQPMLDLCRENNGNHQKLNTVLTRLPEADGLMGPFPLLVCSSVIEYVPDLERSVERIAGLLEKGGRAIVSVPNSRSLYRKAELLKYRMTGRPEYFKYVCHMLDERSFADLFARHGLDLLEVQYYGSGTGTLKKMLGWLPGKQSRNLVVGVFAKT